MTILVVMVVVDKPPAQGQEGACKAIFFDSIVVHTPSLVLVLLVLNAQHRYIHHKNIVICGVAGKRCQTSLLVKFEELHALSPKLPDVGSLFVLCF